MYHRKLGSYWSLHSIIHSTSGAKSRDYPGSCSSLLIHLCRKCLFLFVYCSARSLDSLVRKNHKKYDILMQRWSFESVPVSLPPCTEENQTALLSSYLSPHPSPLPPTSNFVTSLSVFLLCASQAPGRATLTIFPRARKQFFGLKYLNSLIRIRDPRWKIFGSGIRDKHPGSTTLPGPRRIKKIMRDLFV